MYSGGGTRLITVDTTSLREGLMGEDIPLRYIVCTLVLVHTHTHTIFRRENKKPFQLPVLQNTQCVQDLVTLMYKGDLELK